MSQNQFMHMSTAGRVSSQGDKLTVSECIAEALRLPGNYPHVQNPKTPETLFLASGPLLGLPALIDQMEAENRASGAQATRIDGQVLLTGVTSFPYIVDSARVYRDLTQWTELDLAWLHRRVPTLCGVLRHNDESRPHHHGYGLPFKTQKGLSLGSMHPGQHAGRKARKEAQLALQLKPDDALLKKIYNDAYKRAMELDQIDYWKHVGAEMGWSIHGPRRERLARAAILAQKAAAKQREELEKALDEAAAERSESARLRSELERLKRSTLRL